jgi:hypothetical protein
LTHTELVSYVERQLDKWPLTPGKIKKSSKKILKEKLLDPGLGFTTIQPEAAAATPSLSASTNAHHGPGTPHGALITTVISICSFRRATTEEGLHREECGPTEPVEHEFRPTEAGNYQLQLLRVHLY